MRFLSLTMKEPTQAGDQKEIAFFSNGEWVTDIIEEFAGYTHAEPDGHTRVYGWVPIALLDPFLETYRA